MGFVYDVLGRVQLDPDKQIQNIINFFFSSFQRAGSATGIVKIFTKENLKIPQRVRKGTHKGEIVELPLTHARALNILHNPRYAGAFVYGRKRTSHIVGACKIQNCRKQNGML